MRSGADNLGMQDNDLIGGGSKWWRYLYLEGGGCFLGSRQITGAKINTSN